MIFYHVSRPHPTYSAKGSPSLVRICCTTDQEHDACTQVHPNWLKRPRPGETYQSDSYRARHTRSTVGPSIYMPPALTADIPEMLYIADHEVDVCHTLRGLNRARWRRDFNPWHQGVPFNRLRFALPTLVNPLLTHCVQQFLRAAPPTMFAGELGLAELYLADKPAKNTESSVLAADGTRFNPQTGEIL